MNEFWYMDGFNIFLGGGALGKMNKQKMAKYKNNIVFQNTWFQILEDAMTRYKIVEKGKDTLPDTLNQRVILQSFIWYANCVFFDKSDNVFALPGVPDGSGFNWYGDPSGAWIFSRNGRLNENVKLYIPGSDESVLLKESNAPIQSGKIRGVMVWENKSRVPFVRPMMYYAEQIADTMRTLEVARKQLKVPYIIFAEESITKTIADDIKRKDNNEETIFSTGVYDPNKATIFPLQGATETVPRCIELVEWYWSKVKELNGICNNSQIDKKGENLIEAELSIGEEYTDNALEKIKPVIEKGLDDVRRVLGLNLEIITRLDDREEKEKEEQKQMQEAMKNDKTSKDVSRGN